ncbi:MAG: hypothetical protein P8X42_18990 [Calditrichaceae bacterium]
MNEKVFKYLAIFLGIVVIWAMCSGPNDRQDNYNVNVQTMVSSAEGLDLKAVGALLKKADDAKTFEKLLNSKEEGVNNLDLNEDGKVDYISVTEFGNDSIKGFSLTTEPTSGEVQEIATIEIKKVGNNEAKVQIQGNQQIYGNHHYYHSHFGLTDMLIMGYLFRPHGFYASPWSYGVYPGYYHTYSTIPMSRYHSNVNRAYGGTNFRSSNSPTIRSNIKSPNAGKTARTIRAPLKNPTSSQKAFQARNPSKQVKSGGFGRRGSSVRRSASSRSGSYSRGGK